MASTLPENSRTAAAASSPELDKDPATRILRRGDLVRVSEHGKRSSKRLRDRDDALGRVVKCYPDLTFDIEWILGGRLAGVQRDELVHTTAASEGMLDDGGRRRKRQASAHLDASSTSPEEPKKKKSSPKKATAKKTDAAGKAKKQSGGRAAAKKPSSGKAAAKKPSVAKAVAKKPSVAKAVAKKSSAAKAVAKMPSAAKAVAKKPSAAKAVAKKPSAAKAVAKKAKAAEQNPKATKAKTAIAVGQKRKVAEKQKTVKKQRVEEAPAEQQSTALDMYERHRREFERIVARLEKVDRFGYFWDEAPEEFDEKYDDPAENNAVETSTAPLASENNDSKETTTQNAKKASLAKPTSPCFPSHPPYNWEMIRRRTKRGRYVLDREQQEEDERFRIMGPYYDTLGKKRPRRKSKKTKKSEPNPRVLHPKGVNWKLFRDDVIAMCDAGIARDDPEVSSVRGSITHAAAKIKENLQQAYDRTGARHAWEMSYADDRHRFGKAIESHRNTEAAMQSWRRQPFPERRYEQLSNDVVSAGLSSLDERIATYELKTSLPDSFVGLSYKYDDTGQSEAWMKSVVDETGASGRGKSASKEEVRQAALALAADDGVTRAQVNASMQSLLIAVQDRVMTEAGVLAQPELRSANWIDTDGTELTTLTKFEPPEQEQKNGYVDRASNSPSNEKRSPQVVEQPVWGIDCYTRRNILVCLETEFQKDTSLFFVEKWLLPAINACPEELGHDLSNATRILEGLPFKSPDDAEEKKLDNKSDEGSADTHQWSYTLLGGALLQKIRASAPSWLKPAANLLRRAIIALGPDFFRVHPKGHGSVLLSQKVNANTLVTFYRGEVYPSWRWGEKMDAIEITQQRKGLKPALPDFYNMALERPQTDPRGYGLLFVDASRKAGHGSSLSHSCAPTCEVRVAAVNGELCLAMTTLRELEMGEELTFDYNAVTESLNEYQSAVCLCGYGKCRGSFLHFATADCYQQVLNRNAPMATRFSNLVKGSMKLVMSDDDEGILESHGFLTAAFGAISVNRREESASGESQALVDSIKMVPVWLRTYVADVLRYIEYERRALPIALICDHLSSVKRQKLAEAPSLKDSNENEPSKPEAAFFYFVRTQVEFVDSLMKTEEFARAAEGFSGSHARKKVGSVYWQGLDEEKKQYWKDRALAEFEKRKRAWRAAQKRGKKDAGLSGSEMKSRKNGLEPEISDVVHSSNISFQDADAEGVSAMEQRIQQLTQTLSRVGRVLDRHREGCIESEEGSVAERDATSLRKIVHSPLSVFPDEKVVSWIWSSAEGPVSSLIRSVKSSKCVRPHLLEQMLKTKTKYSQLDAFDRPTPTSKDYGHRGSHGRKLLNEALLELRTILLQELTEMGKMFRAFKAKLGQESSGELQVDAADNDAGGADGVLGGSKSSTRELLSGSQAKFNNTTRSIVSSLMDDIVCEVERRFECANDCTYSIEGRLDTDAGERLAHHRSESQKMIELNPWLAHYSQRFVLQAAADMLLLYARTANFFVMNPYRPLESTPIEVYARELGNSVPRSVIDEDVADCTIDAGATDKSQSLAIEGMGCIQREPTWSTPPPTAESTKCSPRATESVKSAKKASDDAELCMPDDIVAEVSVKYQGDYVLSQLLQWYTGGIGLKPGLPDMLGCVLLPSMNGCFSSELLVKSKIKADRKTAYETKVRPRLIEWLQDPYQRGSPWPDEIRRAFAGQSSAYVQNDASTALLPFGSPIVDFLVTGDESNIFAVLSVLDADNKVASKSGDDNMLLSVDKGRPAQAVSTWVQCENPKCMKWRKIPWYVDIDLLPDKFYCKENKWNPEVASCDVPEDEWDGADKLVGSDGKVEGSPVKKKRDEELSPLDEASFTLGARFDVLRKVQGKEKYSVGTVVLADFSGKVKRIKFHFAKTSVDSDEWVEFGSPRIFRRHSKIPPPKKRKDTKRASAKVSGPTKVSGKKTSSKLAQGTNGKASKEIPAQACANIAEKPSSMSDYTDLVSQPNLEPLRSRQRYSETVSGDSLEREAARAISMLNQAGRMADRKFMNDTEMICHDPASPPLAFRRDASSLQPRSVGQIDNCGFSNQARLFPHSSAAIVAIPHGKSSSVGGTLFDHPSITPLQPDFTVPRQDGSSDVQSSFDFNLPRREAFDRQTDFAGRRTEGDRPIGLPPPDSGARTAGNLLEQLMMLPSSSMQASLNGMSAMNEMGFPGRFAFGSQQTATASTPNYFEALGLGSQGYQSSNPSSLNGRQLNLPQGFSSLGNNGANFLNRQSNQSFNPSRDSQQNFSLLQRLQLLNNMDPSLPPK